MFRETLELVLPTLAIAFVVMTYLGGMIVVLSETPDHFMTARRLIRYEDKAAQTEGLALLRSVGRRALIAPVWPIVATLHAIDFVKTTLQISRRVKSQQV